MTNRLKLAVEQAAARLTDACQEQFAEVFDLVAKAPPELAQTLLTAVLNEFKWNLSFATSQDKLKALADEARREYEAGETDDLDPDKL